MEISKKYNNIGIYGGTFAPPHNGHVRIALKFSTQFDLDLVYVIPTYSPPHKSTEPGDCPNLRLKMTKAAFDGLSENIVVSDYEIMKKGISYTADTLEYFKNTANQIYFLCGDDMFVTLDTWRFPEKIFRDARIVCARRDLSEKQDELIRKKTFEYENEYAAKIHFLDLSPYKVSSSDIRMMVKNKEKISDLVPIKVEKIINENKIYG